MITLPTDTKQVAAITAVSLEGVGKRYPLNRHSGQDTLISCTDFWALRDVTLTVEQGRTCGIIGRNGAGKSTLLNIIAGTLSASEGRLQVQGRVVGLFNLGAGFQDELSGRENIFLNGMLLGASKKELEQKLSAIVDFSELGDFIDMPLGAYSQGMRLRLGFSIIANLDFDTLVMDEILAVGDALFQNKCFQRLVDFKRAGKTLIITTQDMSLIERLCDNVVLLDHGRLLFLGEPMEAINRYHSLLNTEKFFVGPREKNNVLFENTKKWADDVSFWGEKLGTKEVAIESVGLFNKFGIKTDTINSRDPLKVKVQFNVKNSVREPHFGVAIFRNDGVYCYGPNTAFDGYYIPELKPGRGHFTLDFPKLLLAPGEYRISVAIWDKNETIAFDYHDGYYKLIIKGNNYDNALLDMPCEIEPRDYMHRIFMSHKINNYISRVIFSENKYLDKKRIERMDFCIEYAKLSNYLNETKEIFVTGESLRLNFRFNYTNLIIKKSYIWCGVYRDDGIYCQGISTAFKSAAKFSLFFPKVLFLPGGYYFSIGIWDASAGIISMYKNSICAFKVVSERQDHGTIFLEHKWKWVLP